MTLIPLLFTLKEKVTEKLNRNLYLLVGLLTDRLHFVMVEKEPGPSNIKKKKIGHLYTGILKPSPFSLFSNQKCLRTITQ